MDNLVKEFFLAKNIRESTKKHYLVRLHYYCSFIDKNPSQMIEEAENEEEEIRVFIEGILDFFINIDNEK